MNLWNKPRLFNQKIKIKFKITRNRKDLQIFLTKFSQEQNNNQWEQIPCFLINILLVNQKWN